MSSPDAGRQGIGQRSITAMLWGAGGSVLRVGLQIFCQIALARLLGPESYGVFAVAIAVILLSSLFADVGLAYGLIQRQSVSEADIRFIFTWQTLLGAGVMLVLMAAAPAIARLYGDARLVPVIAVLAPSCLANAAGATAGALLRREMDFKTLNVAQVVGYAAGFLVLGIPLALAGAGSVSLAIAFLAYSCIQAAIQYGRVRHALRPLLWQPDAPEILRFGVTVFATNLLNWAMNGIDRAIVGSALGLAAAGLYSTAYYLISAPLITLLSLLQSVLYSASAKVQQDKAQLRRGLLAALGAALLFVAPLFVGIATAADTIFQALYGARWSGGGAVLGPLALAMPAYLLMGLATPVLWASGATRRELVLQTPIAIAWVATLWLVGKAGSLSLLSWAVCLIFYIRAGILIWATLAAVDASAKDLFGACAAGLVTCAAVAVAGLVADHALVPQLGRGVPLLAADVAACGIALLAGLRLVGPLLGEDMVLILRQIADRAPGGSGHMALARVLGR